MACAAHRDAISARLDGELSPDEAEHLDAHLDGCAECRAWSVRAEGLHRALRVRPADDVPDLRERILAALDPPRPAVPPVAAATSGAGPEPVGAGAGTGWLRYGLAVIGLAMVVLALPSMLGGDTQSALHLSRELGAWDAAFGAGLVVAAWQPERARGLLPMAAVLGGTMVVVAVLDVIAGRVPLLNESSHTIELVGMALLWALARRTGSAPARPLFASRHRTPRPTSWHAA